MIDFSRINQSLNSMASDYCRYILPAGKFKSGQFICGSTGGEAGKSLSVCVSGDKVGVWKDFADNSGGGDLISLTSAVKGISQGEAAKFCADFLKIDLKLVDNQSMTNYHKPIVVKKIEKPNIDEFRIIEKGSDVYKYLTEERKIEPFLIRYFYLREKGNILVFPFVTGKQLVSAKKRNILRGPTIFTGSGFQKTLFGWHQVCENYLKLDQTTVVITEAEIDCITVTQCGMLSLSLPNGCMGLSWFDLEVDFMRRFDKIILCLDMDDAGQKGSVALEEKFTKSGFKNIYKAILPHKDPNDCLNAGVQKDDLKRIILSARKINGGFEQKDIIRFSDSFDEVLEYERLASSDDFGITLPWETDLFKWRPGEISILTGVPGHGKTNFLSQVAIHTILSGRSIFMTSPEMKLGQIGARMFQQATGLDKCTDEIKEKIKIKIFDNLIFHDVQGEIDLKDLFRSMASVIKQENIGLITIDNLSVCKIRNDNSGLNDQREAMLQIVEFANIHNVHIILVAHPRKLQDINIPATQYDVSGSASIVNLADNVFTIWRNEKKEVLKKKLKFNPESLTEKEKGVIKDADAKFICNKCRFDGKKFMLRFWFHEKSCQFLMEGQEPIKYISRLTEA